MKKNRRGNEKGFTLMEIIMVMVCTVILLGIGTSSYRGFLVRTRVKGAINMVMTLKKSFNYMASECRGYPARNNTRDGYEFLTIIDIFECDPTNSNPAPYMQKYPYGECNVQTSIGKMMGVDAGQGRNALCRAACNYENDPNPRCDANEKRMISEYFVGYEDSECSPEYSGAPYNGKSPGWNYNLLTSPANPRNQPVGVICAMTRGAKTPVKIVVNTGGYYSGHHVSDGTGIFDIDGTTLAQPCTCGPYCEEVLSGRKGCCAPCGGEESLGYRL